MTYPYIRDGKLTLIQVPNDLDMEAADILALFEDRDLVEDHQNLALIDIRHSQDAKFLEAVMAGIDDDCVNVVVSFTPQNKRGSTALQGRANCIITLEHRTGHSLTATLTKWKDGNIEVSRINPTPILFEVAL